MRLERAYTYFLESYVKHVRRACCQNGYTVPHLKESHWSAHEEQMKLTFYSAADTMCIADAHKQYNNKNINQMDHQWITADRIMTSSKREKTLELTIFPRTCV